LRKEVQNVLICFKRSWSSADFVALNAKDFLAERDLGTSNNATKGSFLAFHDSNTYQANEKRTAFNYSEVYFVMLA